MWTSTNGKDVASKASRMLTLVCVKAAGLRITPTRALGLLVEDSGVVLDVDVDAVGGTKWLCTKSTMAPS